MTRYATLEDMAFLTQHDHHVSADLMQRRIAGRQVYVATGEGDAIVGWLRCGLFWDLLPFMNMLYILEPHRRKGIGRALVGRWEEDMHHLGYQMVLTSTQASEEGQHFYRRLGYTDAGVLLLPGEPAELFFRKQIGMSE